MEPRVLVAVPCFNAASTIADTLASLRAQTYRRLRVVVVDNASTDGTVDLVRRQFPEVDVEANETNIGAEGNFERCFSLPGDEELLAIFHADDVYGPDMVEKQVAVLLQQPDVGIVFSQAHQIDTEGRVVGRTLRHQRQLGAASVAVVDYPAVLRGTFEAGALFVCPSALGRRQVWTDVVRHWDGKRFGTAADVDVWLRAARAWKLAVITEPLMGYRLSPQQGTALYLSRRTERSDLVRVLEHYLAQPADAALLSSRQRRSFTWISYRDDVVLACNALVQGRTAQAREMLRREPRLSTWRSSKVVLLHVALRLLLTARAHTPARALASRLAGR